jgi:hypothetical protein
VKVISWNDTEYVVLFSMYHRGQKSDKGKEKGKPIFVLNYNLYMGYANLKDKHLQPCLLE